MSRTGSGISIHRSGDTSCITMFIGKRTERKSGVTGSIVPGWRTGVRGVGMSAFTLYQAFGMRVSSSRKRPRSVMRSSRYVPRCAPRIEHRPRCQA